MSFDLTKPGAAVISSSFGGGWILPLTPECDDLLTEFLGEPPYELPAVEHGAIGWIMEPQDCEHIANRLIEAGISWELQ